MRLVTGRVQFRCTVAFQEEIARDETEEPHPVGRAEAEGPKNLIAEPETERFERGEAAGGARCHAEEDAPAFAIGRLGAAAELESAPARCPDRVKTDPR